MKIIRNLLLACALFPLTANATPEDDRFQKLAKDYIEGLLQANPEYATSLGDHLFDDKLTDYSDEAEAKQLKRARDFGQQLEELNDLTKRTRPNNVEVSMSSDYSQSQG